MERREIRVFPGRPGGGFGAGSAGLPIDKSFLTVEAGPPGLPVVAMTDDGLSVLHMKPGSTGDNTGPELSWETVLAERSVLAGTGFAGTNDPRRDLLDRRPRQTVDLGGAQETVTVAIGAGSEGVDMESSRSGSLGGTQVVDLDGDSRPEILLASPNVGGRGRVIVVRLGG